MVRGSVCTPCRWRWGSICPSPCRWHFPGRADRGLAQRSWGGTRPRRRARERGHPAGLGADRGGKGDRGGLAGGLLRWPLAVAWHPDLAGVGLPGGLPGAGGVPGAAALRPRGRGGPRGKILKNRSTMTVCMESPWSWAEGPSPRRLIVGTGKYPDEMMSSATRPRARSWSPWPCGAWS